MALYCLCDIELTKPLVMVVMPATGHAMQCIKTGAEQYLKDGPGITPRRHFPNVDIFECQKCGTRIAREA